ncbi:glycoside hydrolase family 16 protein [Gloeopeniophorella convolvens]|nr:glycoside hydrolase family 16 protein [Gloeopeniophorella convolvens]
MLLTSALLLSSASLALASGSDGGSLRARHSQHARTVQARGKQYNLVDRYHANDFMDESQWQYFTGPDPTNGRVKYLSHADASKAGIAYVQSDNTTVLAVDSTTDLSNGANRNSVRISTTKTYSRGLFIADFFAMPHGCGVWPAWWSSGPNWPNAGEIDIIEGVNKNPTNQYTLHSGAGSGSCTLDKDPPVPAGVEAFTANVLGIDCDTTPETDAGCAFSDPKPTSFGHGFNMLGGGVFAHLWDSTGIKMWHFERQSIPQDIQSGQPDPTSWPAPAAFWSSTSCDFPSHFYDHQLILDTTLCGGWADSDYPNSGCPLTCDEFVATGSNFKFAKWVVNYIAVYE